MSNLLFRSLRPITLGKSSQEHIWIRLLNPSPVSLLTRVVGTPCDLLIRVPKSTLSKTLNQDHYTRCSQENVQSSELNLKNLQNARFLLLPRRRFGLSRKDPAFGHQRFHGRITWLEPMVFGILLLAFFSTWLDWRKLKEEHGIDILPEFLYKGFTQAVDQDELVKYDI